MSCGCISHIYQFWLLVLPHNSNKFGCQCVLTALSMIITFLFLIVTILCCIFTQQIRTAECTVLEIILRTWLGFFFWKILLCIGNVFHIYTYSSWCTFLCCVFLLQVDGQCYCKVYVEGRQCDTCKAGHFNLQTSNPEGCDNCSCVTMGTKNGDITCHPFTGVCNCKDNVRSMYEVYL